MARPAKKRFAFARAVLVAAVLLTAVGIFLGVRATSVPSVGPDTASDMVAILADEPGVHVDLLWTVDPSGEVTAFLSAEAPSNDSFDIYVVLSCDARLTGLHYPPRRDLMYKTKEIGSPDACVEDALNFSDETVATQTITLPFRGDGTTVGDIENIPARFRGQPVVSMTESSGGIRVIRTPRFELRDMADSSTVTVELDAKTTEELDEAKPQSLSDGTSSSVTHLYIDAARFPSVVWQTAGALTLEAGFARWRDSAGLSAAQLSLLLSGAFLGVSASLLVEVVFDRARAANSAEAEQLAGGRDLRSIWRNPNTSGRWMRLRRRIAEQRARRFRARPTWVSKLSVRVAWIGASLIAVSGGLLATAGFSAPWVGIYAFLFHLLGLVAFAVHYLARPNRDGLVVAAMYATAAILSVIFVTAGPGGSRFWTLLLYGLVLMIISGWLAIAGRSLSPFARSLRTPAVWVVAAGAIPALISVGIQNGAMEWSSVWLWLGPVLLVLWSLSIVGQAVGYGISARRLTREAAADAHH